MHCERTGVPVPFCMRISIRLFVQKAKGRNVSKHPELVEISR